METWVPSTMHEADIQDLVERWLLPEKVFGWRCCYGEEFPTEDRIEMVVFQSFYEKGFAVPAGAFFHGLLHFYGLISSRTQSCRSRFSFMCARGSWDCSPLQTFDGLCTASWGTVQ